MYSCSMLEDSTKLKWRYANTEEIEKLKISTP